MEDDYGPSPAAQLIERQRLAIGTSVREAARLADLSEGRWRQIAKGYQQAARGVRVPVNAPAPTLARMAHVVGVTADELDKVGAPHVADELARLYRRTVIANPALQEHLEQTADVPLAEATDDELLAEVMRRLRRAGRERQPEGQEHGSAPKSRAGVSPAHHSAQSADEPADEDEEYVVARRTLALEPDESATPSPGPAPSRRGQP